MKRLLLVALVVIIYGCNNNPPRDVEKEDTTKNKQQMRMVDTIPINHHPGVKRLISIESDPNASTTTIIFNDSSVATLSDGRWIVFDQQKAMTVLFFLYRSSEKAKDSIMQELEKLKRKAASVDIRYAKN